MTVDISGLNSEDIVSSSAQGKRRSVKNRCGCSTERSVLSLDVIPRASAV